MLRMEKQTKGVHLLGDGLSVSAAAYGQTLLQEGSSLGYQLALCPREIVSLSSVASG